MRYARVKGILRDHINSKIELLSYHSKESSRANKKLMVK
jgi:hypothetical protein